MIEDLIIITILKRILDEIKDTHTRLYIALIAKLKIRSVCESVCVCVRACSLRKGTGMAENSDFKNIFLRFQFCQLD